jgi:hypothetical protein
MQDHGQKHEESAEGDQLDQHRADRLAGRNAHDVGLPILGFGQLNGDVVGGSHDDDLVHRPVGQADQGFEFLVAGHFPLLKV